MIEKTLSRLRITTVFAESVEKVEKKRKKNLPQIISRVVRGSVRESWVCDGRERECVCVCVATETLIRYCFLLLQEIHKIRIGRCRG